MADLILIDRRGGEHPVKLFCKPGALLLAAAGPGRSSDPRRRERVWSPPSRARCPGSNGARGAAELLRAVRAQDAAGHSPASGPTRSPEYWSRQPHVPGARRLGAAGLRPPSRAGAGVDVGAGHSVAGDRAGEPGAVRRADARSRRSTRSRSTPSSDGVPGMTELRTRRCRTRRSRCSRSSARTTCCSSTRSHGQDRRRRAVDLQPDPAAPAPGRGRAHARRLPAPGTTRRSGCSRARAGTSSTSCRRSWCSTRRSRSCSAPTG